jgi:methionyl-tRNA formyltransferase
MGSPDFAVPSLDALVESGRYRPVLVVSQPDRPRGRGRVTSPTPVRQRALDLGISTRTMDRASYADGVAAITAERPEFVVVVAFGVILRRDLLDLPARGCVNVHASLLPKYRGVAPIQAAILAGDTVTGCTTMRIDEGVDTGDMLLRDELTIDPDDTAGTLTARLAKQGARLLVRTLDGLVDGSVTPIPQDHTRATTTRKIRKAHGAIDWAASADAIVRQVRAMTPWPSAFTWLHGRRIIVDRALARPAPPDLLAGTVLSTNPLVVASGEGAVDILSLRPEGGKAMSAAEFAAGRSVAIGDVVSSTPPIDARDGRD